MFGSTSPGGDMGKIMSIMRDEDGIAELLQQPVYDFSESDEETPTASQADIIADIINIMRLDVYRIAQAQDIDIEVKRMTPEAAAMMMQNLVKGEGLEIVDQFNEIESHHEEIIESLTDEETLAKHQVVKEDHLYSNTEYDRPTPLEDADEADLKSIAGDEGSDPEGQDGEDTVPQGETDE